MVVKSSVEPSLSQTTVDTKGKNSLEKVKDSVEVQIKGNPILPDSVQDPGSPSSAQVQLKTKSKDNMVLKNMNANVTVYQMIIMG